MGADELIVKKRGDKFSYKIVKFIKGKYTPEDCNMTINIRNYKDLALFFYDLKTLWNAPVDKAITEYSQNKGGVWDIF